ncbi:MAG: aminopeptidase P family protein [Bacteroidaceae bacterium]|nr:aminopeptidase P family protein [Bacteroidaceae bacterium]
MDNTIALRVASLRKWMSEQGLDAFIVPTADPHGSEYLPDHWKCREWLTGFTGSAGTAVVTQYEAALWTDSRYFLQATAELNWTPFHLMREGEAATPDIATWLNMQTDVVAVGGDAWLLSQQFADTITKSSLDAADTTAAHTKTVRPALRFVLATDPFATLWTDRPPLPTGKIVTQPETYVSRTAGEKLAALAAPLPPGGYLLLHDLSEIAWTLNLRGCDIEYNPVFLAYLFVGETSRTLCTDIDKLTPQAQSVLNEAGVTVRPYADALQVTDELVARGCTFLQMSNDIPAAFTNRLQECALKPILATSPVSMAKAVKDEGEQAGFRLAMERDGVALVTFRHWLDEALSQGEHLTEQDIDRRLTALRAAQPGFESLSFGTIAAAGAHGAVVHYEAAPTAHTPLPQRGFLLLDSGAQYDSGTTDITRTIPLGPLTDEERLVYTYVLKAHIGLARLRFPEGTNGLQADTAARAPLWQAGYDFGHGTGHGVGSHLCVHEGPHQIRKDKRLCTMVPLLAGMTITDEPGVYLEGKFGVRLENVLLVRKADDGFLCFEPLTLCPFDTAPIVRSLLTHEERSYLNAYHAEVRQRLLPLLTDEAVANWLVAATEAL